MKAFTPTPLEEAVHALRALRPPDLVHATAALKRVGFFLQVAGVFAELYPEEYQEWTGQATLPAGALPETLSELESRALAALGRLFPLADFALEEQLFELGGFGEELYLPIEPAGFPYSWDDLSEIMENPSSLDASESLLFFLKYLDLGVDPSAWELAAGHFGWPGAPGYLNPADVRKIDHLDNERLFALLDAHGLDCFQAAFKVIWGGTGNLFLDYSYEELYEIVEPIPFSVENVRLLALAWQEAQTILERIREAETKTQDDPGLLERILEAYERSLVFKDP